MVVKNLFKYFLSYTLLFIIVFTKNTLAASEIDSFFTINNNSSNLDMLICPGACTAISPTTQADPENPKLLRCALIQAKKTSKFNIKLMTSGISCKKSFRLYAVVPKKQIGPMPNTSLSANVGDIQQTHVNSWIVPESELLVPYPINDYQENLQKNTDCWQVNKLSENKFGFSYTCWVVG